MVEGWDRPRSPGRQDQALSRPQSDTNTDMPDLSCDLCPVQEGGGSARRQRWLTLADSFTGGFLPADASALKTPGGIARTNSVTDVHTGDCYLFETLSRANHSCAPNMRFTLPAFPCDGGAVTLSMLSDVPKGSALTISYLPPDDLERPTAERRALLSDKFNFVCGCERCGPAAAEPRGFSQLV